MIKTEDEIKKMREGGKILGYILNHLSEMVAPGIGTEDLEKEAVKMLDSYKLKPSFKGYTIEGHPPYPTVLCTSINDEVVHSPSLPNKILNNGDIISIDMGLVYEGMFLDSALTVPVGSIDDDLEKLLQTTRNSLYKAIDIIKNGTTIGDIGYVIEKEVEDNGFKVVKELVGHGVGKKIHEPPSIPNFGEKGSGMKLKTGMTIAIEPMVNMKDWRVVFYDNEWRVTTYDKMPSAHFEHTILVLDGSCEVLTEYK